MQSKKILFANIPADGHFNPLTGIAMELKNQGHDVRW
jgi:UDP:flavonoid glycosyltransferase YjiC (YdhE family)